MKDWVIGISLSALAVFAPIKALFLVTGILILSDLVTGILAARKRGQKISSAAMRRTITKVFVYQCAIGIGFLIETYMLDGFVPVSKIAAGLISLVEGRSIYENLDVINGSSVFKSLIKKLGSTNDISEIASTVEKEDKQDPNESL
jgi:hypothetical protein